MQEDRSYVIFSSHGLTYGLDAIAVKEIFSMPELTVAVDAPDHIVGLLNLRGKLVPIMDPNRLFGYSFQAYQLSDSIITLERGLEVVGIVVNQVHEVVTIPTEVIERSIYGQHTCQLIGGVAKLGEETITILKPEALLGALSSTPDGQKTTAVLPNPESSSDVPWVHRQGNFFATFCPKSTPQEQQTFHQRAVHLMARSQRNDLTGLRPLAVVGLGEEYFGLDLEVVREFTEFHQVTPIPCCPEHVVGNINLRGEIVTLIDIRRALHMQVNEYRLTSKAIVIHIDDLVMGIPVEKVFDVLYLQKTDIKPNPMVTVEGDHDYLQGTVRYQDKMMGILNLPKIFADGNLSVDEEV